MIRCRFAPSPTGPIHIGNIRTALFNYLFSRSLADRSRMVLRIEDTDLQRSSIDYEQLIYNELKWMGIDWDEGPDKGGNYGPYRQTERLDIYKEYIDRLIKEGKAYYCYCTPEELEQDKKKSVETCGSPRYSGRCRSLSAEQIEAYKREGRVATVRFKVADNLPIIFDDVVKGRIEINSDTLGGDLVIQKSDGMPTYNFAVVIDDHLMEITHVIRGEDHLSNTPKQILIYDAFGWQKPVFAHAPLILGPDRTKLSKRHGNTYIGQYREDGYLPEAMFNYLSLLSWAPEGDKELLTKEEIITQFKLDRVTKANPVFDIDKLNWINAHYIRQSSIDRITDLAIPFLIGEGLITEHDAASRKEWISLMVSALQESLIKVSDIADKARMFFGNQIAPEDEEAARVLKQQHVRGMLELFKSKVAQAESVNEEFCSTVLKSIQKETGIKGKGLFMTVRVAITGKCHGPDLVKTMRILGREKIIARVEHTLNNYVNGKE
jgi:nondiscriminating glutamyl-tRNA synthetase